MIFRLTRVRTFKTIWLNNPVYSSHSITKITRYILMKSVVCILTAVCVLPEQSTNQRCNEVSSQCTSELKVTQGNLKINWRCHFKYFIFSRELAKRIFIHYLNPPKNVLDIKINKDSTWSASLSSICHHSLFKMVINFKTGNVTVPLKEQYPEELLTCKFISHIADKGFIMLYFRDCPLENVRKI